MDSKDLENEQKEKSFRVSTEKLSNGMLFLVFIVLSGILNTYEQGIKPYSLSMSMALSIAVIRIILDTGAPYFLTLWIIDLIRKRGKIERPENKKVKLIVNIIFAIIGLMMIYSVFLMYTAKPSSTEIDSKQTSFISLMLEKNKEFSNENDKVKTATQSFLDVINNENWTKMHDTLGNLLNAAQALQPKIEEMKVFAQQSSNLFSGEKDKQASALYTKVIDVRDRYNKKVIELATFGLTIDWKNPTETQITKWTQLADELGTIENEVKNIQAELQNAIQAS
jgi:amino acid transporter